MWVVLAAGRGCWYLVFVLVNFVLQNLLVSFGLWSVDWVGGYFLCSLQVRITVSLEGLKRSGVEVHEYDVYLAKGMRLMVISFRISFACISSRKSGWGWYLLVFLRFLSLVVLWVPAVVSLSGKMSFVWLWHGRGRDRGLLSEAANPVTGIVGLVIVLELTANAWFVTCVVRVQVGWVSGEPVVMGGWVCSTFVKWFICVEVLFKRGRIEGYGPL